MAVYALDREKDLDVYETFIGSVIKSRGKGDEQEPRHSTSRVTSTLSWSYHVQMMTTSRSSARCMTHYVGREERRFKKLLWYEIVKEFNCKVTSICFHAQTNWERWKRKDDAAGLHHRAQEDI